MPYLLWTPACLAPVALVACGNLGSLLPDYADLRPLNDATSSSSGPTSVSSGTSSSGSSSGGEEPGASSGSSGSGSSSDGTSSSGSSGGSGSSSGSVGSSDASPGPSDGGTSDVYVGYCGDKYCNYHSNTCCLPADAGSLDAAYCVSGNQSGCGANVVTYHCLGAVDCPTSGEVCCGVVNATAMTGGTSCQRPPCTNPQFCLGNAECNGQTCTAQSCLGVSPLYLCGLQRAAPYNCTAVTP